MFSSSLSIVHGLRCLNIAWEGMKCCSKFCAYPRVTAVQFTDQNWISKTVYFIRSLMVCKLFSCSEFPKRPEKTGKCKAFCKNKKIHNERQWDIYYTYFQSIIFRFLRIWQSYRLLQTKRINKCKQLEKLGDKKSHTFTEKKDEIAME